jgi:hypothetical protein
MGWLDVPVLRDSGGQVGSSNRCWERRASPINRLTRSGPLVPRLCPNGLCRSGLLQQLVRPVPDARPERHERRESWQPD